MFNHLELSGGVYGPTSVKRFVPSEINSAYVARCFDFAWDMSFGNEGVHRSHRSGGTHQRKNGEIFSDAFQGKLAEFCFYGFLKENGIDAPEPDVACYGSGIWDDSDFSLMGKTVSIKSTANYGNLLLLETKDWDSMGRYVPNIDTDHSSTYDYMVLVRVKPNITSIMKANRMLYSIHADKSLLESIVSKTRFFFDIPGYISLDDLIEVVAEQLILPQGALLNTTKMDAENYYVQSGDMRIMRGLIEEFSND